MRLPSPMGSRMASSMVLTPRTISAYAPWNCSGLPRSESWPSFDASVSRAISFCRPAYDGHVVDRDLHLFVVALVGLRDQFVDLAAGDLRQNAVAFADGQQNGVQHLVDALNHLAVRAVEQGRLAALGELAFLRSIHQAHDLVKTSIESSSANCGLPVRLWFACPFVP
jgi:hypothetical protein